MNGKSLNPPRVHGFDEEFRKESQNLSLNRCCTRLEGFPIDMQGIFMISNSGGVIMTHMWVSFI